METPKNSAQIFQSTPSVGRATLYRGTKYNAHSNFNPRPPWGGRLARWQIKIKCAYFNPRPPWGGRPKIAGMTPQKLDISIHALRGEGDCYSNISLLGYKYFNPRPPWGGRPVINLKATVTSKIFQSTPSVGRATNSLVLAVLLPIFQSTPSVGRATDSKLNDTDKFILFQSTPSVGRATAKIYKYAMLCLYIVHIKLYIFATAVLFI